MLALAIGYVSTNGKHVAIYARDNNHRNNNTAIYNICDSLYLKSIFCTQYSYSGLARLVCIASELC